MINAQNPINGLIADLEECLSRIDGTGQALAGAHLSSAIDSLKAAMINGPPVATASSDRCKAKPLTFH
ncbi:hypothetical protein [Novosphingobium sp.]|uniref:hypothetical protein n=1 Tax=Novosphingobium sp. TaxID=1874826 RepID=UPI0025CF188F|nr:hypothetical protein [Novosphingobium sp.]